MMSYALQRYGGEGGELVGEKGGGLGAMVDSQEGAAEAWCERRTLNRDGTAGEGGIGG